MNASLPSGFECCGALGFHHRNDCAEGIEARRRRDEAEQERIAEQKAAEDAERDLLMEEDPAAVRSPSPVSSGNRWGWWCIDEDKLFLNAVNRESEDPRLNLTPICPTCGSPDIRPKKI